MSDAAATLRAHGRQPDAQLKNGRGANLLLSDGARCPREGPNARPMPKATLSDVRDHAAAVAPTGSGAVPEAVHFAIYVDSYRVAPDVAVAVPAEHIW